MAAKAVIRVGVTGHRAFEDAEDAVAGRARVALGRVVRLAGADGSDTAVRLEVLSGLAEGADRLVAHVALAMPDATLLAVLPLPVEEYERDFGGEASRHAFAGLLDRARAVDILPPQAVRDAAYEAQGRWIVDHCDVLVAVWDGRSARGRGGTADIVGYAADRGTPLLWIRVTRP